MAVETAASWNTHTWTPCSSQEESQGSSGKPESACVPHNFPPSSMTVQNKAQSLHIILFFNTIFVSSHMYPENPEGTQVIVGSMNMGYK